jgi:hypothetical protein
MIGTEGVESLETFLEFVERLRRDVENDSEHADRNHTLDEFMEALGRWTQDASRASMYDAAKVDWQLIATMLVMGWTYE